MSNSITITEAAKELSLTLDEFRPLLEGYYKNPEKVKAISWEQMV